MWALNIIVIGGSIGVVMVATGWYVASVVAVQWPEWWQQHVVDDEPVEVGVKLSSIRSE